MRKYLIYTLLVLSSFSFFYFAKAEGNYQKATVLRVVDSSVIKIENEDSYYQKLEIELSDGKKEIIAQGEKNVSPLTSLVKEGDGIIVYKSDQVTDGYEISDRWRLNNLLIIFVVFLILVFIVVGARGLMALVGLAYSLLVLMTVMIPLLISGYNPVLVSLFAGIIIIIPSMVVTHGFNRDSFLATASIIGGLIVALFINYVWSKWAYLSGGGAEEVYFLQVAGLGNLDFKSLFMGGVIVGVLGVLDDVAIGQISVVNEIKRANNSLSKKELMTRSFRVGRSHVLSLVNTLALAYVGTSIPLFLLFVSDNGLPWWVMLNSEGVAEEIIRTLVGSSALVLTVPIATFLAVWYGKENNNFHAHCKH